jgi:hypothetical protein
MNEHAGQLEAEHIAESTSTMQRGDVSSGKRMKNQGGMHTSFVPADFWRIEEKTRTPERPLLATAAAAERMKMKAADLHRLPATGSFSNGRPCRKHACRGSTVGGCCICSTFNNFHPFNMKTQSKFWCLLNKIRRLGKRNKKIIS